MQYQLILDFKTFFKDIEVFNRLDLIKHISKRSLIAEIAGLNNRLKPNISKYLDVSLQTQQKELKYFIKEESKFYPYILNIFNSFIKKDNFAFVFIRPTCLIALEELIQSNHEIEDGEPLETFDHWFSLFKYLVSINSVVTELNLNFETATLEDWNAQSLAINELTINNDPVYIAYRGHCLFEYLSNHNVLGTYFSEYILSKYQMSYENIIYEITSLYIKRTKNPIYNFVYISDNQSESFFKALSYTESSTDIKKLLSIRKFPFYCIGPNTYILLDNIFLLEKFYSQFINDFWFDFIKTKKECQIDHIYYWSVIGNFFEKYVCECIKYCFIKCPHWQVKNSQELKIKVYNQPFEIADVYVRYGQKAIVGEIKATGIYDSQKLGGDIKALYKDNREKFFDGFGLNQLVSNIRKFASRIGSVDSKIDLNKRINIFPVLIVGEKVLKTSLMQNVFRRKFDELLQEEKILNMHVNPLTIIHVSDLEEIQDYINRNPKEIFNLLKNHKRHSKKILTFSDSINRHGIRATYRSTDKLFQKLFKIYNV